MIKNIPNTLTVARIILIPIFVMAFYLPWDWGYFLAGLIFAVAGITDYFDGMLARRLNQTSAFGQFLDPVADKLMVTTAIVLLMTRTDMPYLAIPAMVIVGREIVISALREWMAELGKRANVAVSNIGKAKTVIQLIALGMLIGTMPQFAFWWRVIAYILFYIAAILTLWSMFVYLRAAWGDLLAEAG